MEWNLYDRPHQQLAPPHGEEWLFGLDMVSPEAREKIVTHGSAPGHPVRMRRWRKCPIRERTALPADGPRERRDARRRRPGASRCGGLGQDYDVDVLMSILILHDVDKPLMYVRENADKVSYSQLSRELQHGVVGAMLLKELGLPHTVVSTVATHAGIHVPWSELRGVCTALRDYFSTDHAIMLEGDGKEPYYQKHWRNLRPIMRVKARHPRLCWRHKGRRGCRGQATA